MTASGEATTDELTIGQAQASHNPALIALLRETPVASERLSYRLDRAPDYFAFSRLQGRRHAVLTAESDRLLGTMSVVVNRVHLEGAPAEVAYTGDLRVAPAARGRGVGDRLMREAVGVARAALGPQAPIVTAVAPDNAAGLRKNANLGRDGLTTMRRLATIRTHFLLPLPLPAWHPRYAVRQATDADMPAMHALWARANGEKQLAGVLEAAEHRSWLEDAGLGLDRYWLAEDRRGRLAGFLATWDQTPLRRFMLTAAPVPDLFRPGLSLLSALAGMPPWPGAGEQLRFQNVLHLAVAPGEEEAIAAILPAALARVRQEGGLFLAVATDARDPLTGPLGRFVGGSGELLLLGNEAVPETDRLYHIEIALG